MSALVILGTTSHALAVTPAVVADPLATPPVIGSPATPVAVTWQPDNSASDLGETVPHSWRVRVWSDVDAFVHVDTSAVDASSVDLPLAAKWSGIEVVVAPSGYVSVISAGVAGTVWATRVLRS
jgi:hypothetical protein